MHTSCLLIVNSLSSHQLPGVIVEVPQPPCFERSPLGTFVLVNLSLYCCAPHACLMSASPITHGVQPCTGLPHDSHMCTAYRTLPLWLASLPLHICTDIPVILMYSSWMSHIA